MVGIERATTFVYSGGRDSMLAAPGGIPERDDDDWVFR